MTARAKRFLIAFSCLASAAPTAAQVPALDAVSAQLLALHNRERALFGVAALRWDPALAASAASYGPTLAASGRIQHSPRASRPGQRENLWRGTRGAYSPAQMIASWADERRYFRSGVFPNVSTTGNWLDVAHFTTMVWPATARVGCAVTSDRSWDYLICRYSPPGNIDGRPLVLPSAGERG